MSRVRKVNEKALLNMQAFLEDIEKHQKSNIKFSSTELQVKHGVSKSAWSIIKKLGNFEVSREYALKILEILRLRFDKSTDAPINDAWIAEISQIKELFGQMIDTIKSGQSSPQGFISPQISERVYLIGQIANGMLSTDRYLRGGTELVIDDAIIATDYILNKLKQ